MTESRTSPGAPTLGVAVLEDVRREFRGLRALAEKAMAQVDDAGFFHQLDSEANSIAVIVKHVGGNLRSRWRDVLTTDGEKPDRRRDVEFVIEPGDTRAHLLESWRQGWEVLEGSLALLTEADLLTSVPIRGEPHTIVKAINRALGHAAEHVGQIVLLAKHVRGTEWRTLSVPRGQSEEFNAQMRSRFSQGASRE